MKALIIDSSYLIYRSYFAYPDLSVAIKDNSRDTNLDKNPNNQIQDLTQFSVGAFFGFAKTIMYLLRDLRPNILVFAFDLPEPTWRHQAKSDYKAGRPKPDGNMVRQIPIIKDWCKVITENCLEVAGYEADDCIYSAALYLDQKDFAEILIYSSDKDLYQILSNPKVKLIKTPKPNQIELFTADDLTKKYLVKPQQWVDFKTLLGDPSDNLKGLDGVGEKTASKILTIFGSLKNLLIATEELNLPVGLESFIDYNPTMKNKFLQTGRNAEQILLKAKENKDQLIETYKLSKLTRTKNCHIKNTPYALARSLQIFEKYKFTSLVNLYNKSFQAESLEEIQDTLF